MDAPKFEDFSGQSWEAWHGIEDAGQGQQVTANNIPMCCVEIVGVSDTGEDPRGTVVKPELPGDWRNLPA